VNAPSLALPTDVLVAAGAQGAGTLAQELLEPGHVGVVAGAALSDLHGRVSDTGLEIGSQVVALEADLLLVDVVSGMLGLARGPDEKEPGADDDRTDGSCPT
jgi:hypothetical protein